MRRCCHQHDSDLTPVGRTECRSMCPAGMHPAWMTTVPVAASYASADGAASLLPARQLTIDRSTTCREIATMLLREHGLPAGDLDLIFGGLMVGLPSADDDAWSPTRKSLTATVTAEGRFNWRPPHLDTIFGELQATADAGCCPRPEAGLTLILTGPFGGGGAVDWPQLISLLQTAHDHLYTYLDEAVTVSGGLVLVRQYAQRAVAAIGNGLRAVRVLYDRDALPDPETLDIFLDRSQHLDAEPLSAGFELSETQVDELMELLGYEREDGSDVYALTTPDIARPTTSTGCANGLTHGTRTR